MVGRVLERSSHGGSDVFGGFTVAQVLQERYRLDASAAERAICAFEKEVRRPGAVK